MKSWKRKVVWMSLPMPKLDWETFKRTCSHLSVEDAKERAVVVMERIQRKKKRLTLSKILSDLKT